MRKAAVVAGLLVALSGCARPAEPVAAPASGLVAPVLVTPTATSAVPRPPTPKPPVVPTTADTPPDLESLDDVYLVKNAVYAAGQVPAVPCRLPNVTLRTKKDVQGYSDAMLDCLQRAWKPLVERSDVVFTPTRVYAVDEDAKTGCGTFGDTNDGFYCPPNTAIYLDWHQYLVGGGVDRVWAQVYLQFVVAHEFGHHVQQLVGIMQAYDSWPATTGAAKLEQSRRLELQASCFASAFLGANQTALALRGERLADYHDAAYSGDDDDQAAPRDHGSRRSSTYWAKAAFKSKSPSACNTWAAPTKRVT